MGVKKRQPVQLDDNPLWYKDAVIYELHVRSFYDSVDDGVGDFRGLTEKLDYLQDLGITALWLLPFCPSPLRDDGYDMADYTDVHHLYGVLNDFREFLHEAHRRSIRVITELALNHTSDQHPWFQRARRAAPGSPWRDFYVWSETPDKYHDARIIFKDFEPSNWAWDPLAQAYYWHRFYFHQPDLNYDSPRVRKAILEVVDFWFGLGVDGLRLDAVPYLYEREGTNCENLTETHTFLKELRRHVDRAFKNRLILAEANQWPEDAAAYFGTGDECHMNFHFPLMPRLFMAVHTEDRFPIVDILQQTPSMAENCQWGIFLRNHDELTLEMVTDEERDYMYRVYAQDPQARINLGIRRRLAPLLGNHRRRIELMNGLLFSLPGTPILYYGDEIGMGDNVYLGDRNGVRTPMQWSGDRNAGFSRANPQKLYLPIIIDPEYHYESINVEAQQQNPHSMLWWMKRMIGLRKRHKAFGRGTLEFLSPENGKILAFLRRHQEECILVVANLSRFVQYVELDLSNLRGARPVEMFGRVPFPPIGDLPYLLSLGPHSFFWFVLESPPPVEAGVTASATTPLVQVLGPCAQLFEEKYREALTPLLTNFLKDRRWFGGKARTIRSTMITEVVHFPFDSTVAQLASVTVSYTIGNPETYVLPLLIATSEKVTRVQHDYPQAIIATLRGADGDGVMYEALGEDEFCQALLDALVRRRRFKGVLGELMGVPERTLRPLRGPLTTALPSSLLKAEQSNTSIVYGERLILKFFRRVDEGVNPDLEMNRFLTAHAFPNTAPVAGALEYQARHGEMRTVAIVYGFVPNQGDAWHYTLDTLARYCETALAQPENAQSTLLRTDLVGLLTEEPTALAKDMLGSYLESVRLLGVRTAEMHLTLASEPTDPLFAPEPFSTLYQRSIYQSMRSLAVQSFQLLRRRLKQLPEAVAAEARQVLELENEVFRRFHNVLSHKIAVMRTRYHGDFHLGQVLWTGKDFVIIDFEGEPARPLSERRMKRSPLRDVAGMLRSFHYATYAALMDQIKTGLLNAHGRGAASLEPWLQFWYKWVATTFLKAYLARAGNDAIIPRNQTDLRILLDAFMLEKAVYELSYELNSRPDWVSIPLRGIVQMLTPTV